MSNYAQGWKTRDIWRWIGIVLLGVTLSQGSNHSFALTQPFRMALVSDPHIGDGLDQNFQDVIRDVNRVGVDQVLVAGDDAVIIDFEGEPSRPLAERRRKAPAARDVAGRLRSTKKWAVQAGPYPPTRTAGRNQRFWLTIKAMSEPVANAVPAR